MKIRRSLAQLDVEALELLRRQPGCAQVFGVVVHRIGETGFGLGELVIGQANKDAAARGMQTVHQMLDERYVLRARD